MKTCKDCHYYVEEGNLCIVDPKIEELKDLGRVPESDNCGRFFHAQKRTV